MTIELETICDQLAEAIGLPCGLAVSALIDEEHGNELKGWCIVRLMPYGQMMPINSMRYDTIKDLMTLKDTFDEMMKQAILNAENP